MRLLVAFMPHVSCPHKLGLFCLYLFKAEQETTILQGGVHSPRSERITVIMVMIADPGRLLVLCKRIAFALTTVCLVVSLMPTSDAIDLLTCRYPILA